MNIVFRTDLMSMTYEYHLKQPKPMLEGIPNKKLAKIPELLERFKNSSHSVIRKYQHNIHNEEDEES